MKKKTKSHNVILCNFFLHTNLKRANIWKEYFFELCDDYHMRYYAVETKRRKFIGSISLRYATIKRKITEYEKPNERDHFHLGFCIEITTFTTTHWLKLMPQRNENLHRRMKQIQNWIGLLSSMSEVEEDNKKMREAEMVLLRRKKSRQFSRKRKEGKKRDNIDRLVYPDRSKSTSPVPLFSDRMNEKKTDPIRERFYSHLLMQK